MCRREVNAPKDAIAKHLAHRHRFDRRECPGVGADALPVALAEAEERVKNGRAWIGSMRSEAERLAARTAEAEAELADHEAKLAALKKRLDKRAKAGGAS